MNKQILVKDVDLQMASVAVMLKEKKSCTVLVLSEIIKMSRVTNDLSTLNLSSTIPVKLNISSELYRRSIFLLKKLNLIEKVGVTIVLKDLCKPCDKITVTKL